MTILIDSYKNTVFVKFYITFQQNSPLSVTRFPYGISVRLSAICHLKQPGHPYPSDNKRHSPHANGLVVYGLRKREQISGVLKIDSNMIFRIFLLFTQKR